VCLTGRVFNGLSDESNPDYSNLYPEIIDFDFDALGYEFQVPFYVFQGENDCITPISSAQKYFEKITSPDKKIIAITNAGHLAIFCDPKQFLQELLSNVLKINNVKHSS
jgi:pimeloyl-ACP methyl ester carboxylesterase